MAEYLKAEPTVPAGVPQCSSRRTTNGQTAEDERPGIECKFLPLSFTSLTGELNRFDSFLLAFGAEQVYIVFVCQLTHYGLHVLHTRIAGPADLGIRGPERVQRLLSGDRVQIRVQ
jgi:hypothetical protein